LGLGTTCGWNRTWNDGVPPGHWHSWNWNSGAGNQYHANISGAGGGTTVGLIIKYAKLSNRPPPMPPPGS
jgi:hypothetical protein